MHPPGSLDSADEPQLGPPRACKRVGRGETAATSTSKASLMLQARFDELAVAIDCGAHRASKRAK